MAASLLRMDLSSLSLMGGAVPVRVSTHPRARRMALRIDPQGEAVDLVLPPRGSLPRALAFFEDNRPWLERRLAALPPRTMFAEGALVPVMGEPHSIRHVPTSRGHGAVWIEPPAVVAVGPVVDFARQLDLLA